MLSPLKRWLAGGAVVAVLAAAGGIYLKGRADGRAHVMEKLQGERITILKDGKEIDNAVLGADDAGLCALLGGCELPDDGPGAD